MSETYTVRRSRVYRSLHKPLTYLGVERRIFALVMVAAVVTFNLLSSLLAGAAIFIGGVALGYWITNTDPAFLTILGGSGKFRSRYDAAKQNFPKVEIR